MPSPRVSALRWAGERTRGRLRLLLHHERARQTRSIHHRILRASPSSTMASTLGTLFYVILLIVNAIAILNEERFLARGECEGPVHALPHPSTLARRREMQTLTAGPAFHHSRLVDFARQPGVL